MDAMGIVFPQFWRDEHADESFFKHLAVLKAHFCQNKTVTGWKHVGDTSVPGLLKPEALDAQHAMFRLAMKTNWSTTMSRPFSINPLTRIWQQLGANTILLAGFPEYFKLAEIAIVLVLGSVERQKDVFYVWLCKEQSTKQINRSFGIVCSNVHTEILELADISLQ